MPDGITHHPSVKPPDPPAGHTRVCMAGALGAAKREVIAEWNPQNRYYGVGGPSEEAEAEVMRRARAMMIDGSHCICPKRGRRRRR